MGMSLVAEISSYIIEIHMTLMPDSYKILIPSMLVSTNVRIFYVHTILGQHLFLFWWGRLHSRDKSCLSAQPI